MTDYAYDAACRCVEMYASGGLFTGKERDQESGLDNFGARYFGSSMGRFMSPDFGSPMPNSPDPVPWADFENPQTLNLYAYAPNNGLLTPKQQQCAGAALKKNAVALSFDAAGIGAGFLPGGDLVVAGAQGAVSVASGINSAAHGDASGATLGILGLPASFAGASAKFFGVGAKAIPGIGTAISALGLLNDGYGAYQDYQACLAGH